MGTALVVVDMLNDFVSEEGALPVPGAKDIVLPIKKRLEKARDDGWLIVYLADSHSKDDKEFEVWGEHAVVGTWGNRVIDELSPEENEIVVPKRRFSGFYGTDLDLVLRENEINTLVITGVLTNICVLYTATDAYQRGYKVIVPEDSVAAADDKMHKFAVRQLKEVVGAEVV